MLHELLTLARPLIIFDTETTGTLPDKDRICSLGVLRIYPDGTEKRWHSRVNPLIPIPEETSKIHGITDAMVQACKLCGRTAAQHDEVPAPCPGFKPWPTFVQLAPHIATTFTACDFGGKNIRFDLRITQAEMNRSAVPWDYEDAKIIDLDRLVHVLEPRTLSALMKRELGEEMTDAHDAMADVNGTARLIAHYLKKGDGVFSPSLAAIHDQIWPGIIDADGKFAFNKAGVPIVNFGNKYKGRPMRSVPGFGGNCAPRDNFYGWIIKNNFSARTKQIARDAIAGKLPQPPAVPPLLEQEGD